MLDSAALIAAARGAPVLVLGDVMLDCYASAAAERISREAPVPVLAVRRSSDAPGGAANVAANLTALGAEPLLLSVVGDDEPASRLARALQSCGVEHPRLLAQAGRQTSLKQRLIADGQLVGRIDRGCRAPIDAVAETALIRRLQALWPACRAVIVSDAGMGTITPAVRRALGALQRQAPHLLAVDARHPACYRDLRADLVKPSYLEAAALLGLLPATGAARRGQISAARDQLLDATGAGLVAVTLDADGAVLLRAGERPYPLSASPVAHPSVAGAGDTFIGAMTLALLAGAAPADAAALAVAAAGVAVAKPGTATCSAGELLAALHAAPPAEPDWAELDRRLAEARRRGERMALVCGCFDLLHRGQIACLQAARSADLLIVGVFDDATVRALKGAGRPLQLLGDRLRVLQALAPVDCAVPVHGSAEALIDRVRPHLYVHGEGTPGVEDGWARRCGAELLAVPRLPAYSTAGIVARVRQVNERAAERPAAAGRT